MKNSLISRIFLTLMVVASVGVSSLAAMQQAFSNGSDEQVRLAVYTMDILWAEGQSDKKVFFEIFKTATPNDFEPLTTAIKKEFEHPVYQLLIQKHALFDSEYTTIEEAITANIMIRSVNALKSLIEADRQPYAENIKTYFSNETNITTFLLCIMKQIPEAYKAKINKNMRASLGVSISKTIKSFLSCEKINMPNIQKMFSSSAVTNGVTRQEVLDMIANEQSQQMDKFVRMIANLRQELLLIIEKKQAEQKAEIANVVEAALEKCEKTTREKLAADDQKRRKKCLMKAAIFAGLVGVDFICEYAQLYEGPFVWLLAPFYKPLM